MTLPEVAAELKPNPQAIRNWIDQGKLPAHRLGRRLRVRRDDLDALVGVRHARVNRARRIGRRSWPWRSSRWRKQLKKSPWPGRETCPVSRDRC
ncbi:MAG: helix-turn-helix domain-containing protein [Solirubrobacteraceae bacterium]